MEAFIPVILGLLLVGVPTLCERWRASHPPRAVWVYRGGKMVQEPLRISFFTWNQTGSYAWDRARRVWVRQ